MAIPVILSAPRAGRLKPDISLLEPIMLVTFFVLWPLAAASLFALARFFDRRDQQQLATVRISRRR
ncbi:hypothetical protein GCT13_11660 [Paraburkholderia sp. CNPSo 3157]|uniref:Uncharacterized protein n=1 Tax=Paraburkholderia franconis TaxID=2654983 RepID=A0A7X1N8Y5_9BURK|nr:hypothetical protein [Paraburkholderia franconis]